MWGTSFHDFNWLLVSRGITSQGYFLHQCVIVYHIDVHCVQYEFALSYKHAWPVIIIFNLFIINLFVIPVCDLRYVESPLFTEESLINRRSSSELWRSLPEIVHFVTNGIAILLHPLSYLPSFSLLPFGFLGVCIPQTHTSPITWSFTVDIINPIHLFGTRLCPCT